MAIFQVYDWVVSRKKQVCDFSAQNLVTVMEFWQCEFFSYNTAN